MNEQENLRLLKKYMASVIECESISFIDEQQEVLLIVMIFKDHE